MKIIYIQKRYLLVLFTFLLSFLLYIDRICISVAKEPIAQSLGYTDKQMGWVLSVFALGYALFQTPSGMLADRFGPRKILTTVVFFWSLFTGLTAAAFNFISILIIRFLFGAGEAGAFPNMARAFFSWIPMSERGIVQGINFSGSRLGAAFALPVVALMVSELGWRTSFVILALIGFLWSFIWFIWFRDDPTEHPNISNQELKHILENRQKSEDGEKDNIGFSFKVLFTSRNMWLAMIQYFCSNFTFFFCLTWLFPHLKSRYNLESVEAGFYASAPLIFGALGNLFSGGLVDKIYKSGHWGLSRKIPAITGFFFAAVGLIASVYMDSAFGAIVFLSIAIFGADMTLSPSWSLCIDIGRKHSGAVSGTMSMAGNMGSFITALAFPYLNAWIGSATPFFFIGAGLNLLAVGMWIFIKSDKSLEEY